MDQKEPEIGDNPFADYIEYRSTPWVYYERAKKFRLLNLGIASYKKQAWTPFESAKTKNYDTTEERCSKPCTQFVPRPTENMMRDFFTASGKPKLGVVGKFANTLLIWSVTRGRYRSDRTKRVFVYQGLGDPDIIKLRHGDRGMWKKVDEHAGFGIIADITEQCNQLQETVLRELVRHKSHTKYYKCALENYLYMPEFVQFQSHLKHDHKNLMWRFQPQSQGGNKPDLPPAKPVPNRMQSVHRFLHNYHTWLEPLKS